MASSRKPRAADVAAAARRALQQFEGKRILVGLSGGVDSVALLHALKTQMHRSQRLRAVHIHHGLSPNADAWARFCRRLCKRLGVPLTVRRVRVPKRSEAAARDARYAALRKLDFDVLALAHQLDDQAETVLMSLLRGAGPKGASGMPSVAAFGERELARPFLDVPRESIVAYARAHGLDWIEDESNASDAFTRNFLRLRIGPLLASRYPRWREALARAARHFSAKETTDRKLLREFLASRGLKAPSEAKLVEMLKQLGGGGARTLIEHDGARLRSYRGTVRMERIARDAEFQPTSWRGERRLDLPALRGRLVFHKARGEGIDAKWLKDGGLEVRLRSGGERLQTDPHRPRRTLKNLFQETGVPPWERSRMPLLYRGDELVWAPGLGVDARFRSAKNAAGWVPEWRVSC